MPTYVLPQTLVFQDFSIAPSVVANPLRAHISGGHAFLRRYANADEREKCRLGFYDNQVDTAYEWPDRPAGAEVDNSFVKVWMKDALLQYFTDSIGSGSVISKTAGYNNRVTSATVNFASNGIYGRHSSLYDRDVQPGDVVKLRVQPAEDDPQTIWTYVKALKGNSVDAIIANAVKDASNPATQSGSVSVSKTAGATNNVSASASYAAYDGLASGYISETYKVKVMASSINGDYTTARLRVLSASGTDDVLTATPAASGVPFDVGTRGLTLTFTETDLAGLSQSAENEEVSSDDLALGQEWTIVVNQAFTSPTPTEAGEYDDENDTTYIVEVTEGGIWASTPKISVTTTNGIDLSGPTAVTAAASAVPIGSKGVTIAFSGNGLRKGDRYYVECTGVKEGPMRTIILGHNISSTVPDDSEVDLTLFIRKPLLQISKNRTGFAPLTNWDVSETEITINSGIIAYDETWTDEGVPLPLDVASESSKDYGILYSEYRAWLSELSFDIGTISDVGDLDTVISGALDPTNPLKWGVFKALSNSNGTEVKFTSVAAPDTPDSWDPVLELMLGRDDVYGLVPLTRIRTVLDLYAAHVDSMSAPEQGLWRVLWINLQGRAEVPIVHTGSTIPGFTTATTTDGEQALAVFEDDSLTTGSQYTIMRVPAGNANFVTNGVRPGDVVRGLYVGDGFGNFVHSEFIVDEVESEDQLRLLVGPGAPQSVPAKIEVWRNLTATEEATQVALDSGSWNNRRVRAVWPDQIESGGTVQEGYHLCAALAGLASGILPHQGMTRLEVAGFDRVPRTTNKFTRPQLDIMALAGTWIVTQELATSGGSIYTRHAVTTGDYENINEREEMLTRNIDSISYRFKDSFEPYIGVTNVTPSMQLSLTAEVKQLIELLKTERATRELGGQLIDGTLVELRPHTTLKDRFVCTIRCSIPYALNVFEIHLVV